jgi:hypothetical protein
VLKRPLLGFCSMFTEWMGDDLSRDGRVRADTIGYQPFSFLLCRFLLCMCESEMARRRIKKREATDKGIRCAGWMYGLEYTLWDVVTGRRTDVCSPKKLSNSSIYRKNAVDGSYGMKGRNVKRLLRCRIGYGSMNRKIGSWPTKKNE